MSSLNLTPTLSFEPRFRLFIINGYDIKSKRKSKNLGESLLRGMSKNEQIQFFDSRMYLPVILIP